MAGSMNGSKSVLRSAMQKIDPVSVGNYNDKPLKKAKFQPKDSAPADATDTPILKDPRSAHIREANGGFVTSLSGGGGDSQDHVTKNFGAAIRIARSHFDDGETADDEQANTEP